MSFRSLLLALAALLLPAMAATGQTAADSAGIRAAVLDYVDGVYRVDTARIVRSVHPDLWKRGYWRRNAESAYEDLRMSYPQLVQLAKRWNASGRVDPERAPREVTILDVLDQTASAKLVAQWGVDYLHLAKIDGRWMIVNVLWQSPPAGR